jgi:cytochrome P450
MSVDVAEDRIAYLDVIAPDFRPDSAQVMAARDANWYARTPFGYAILRYRQASAALRDPRFARSSLEWTLTSRGITSGPVLDWLRSIILSTDGADHLRLRRLVSKAFTPRSVDRLRPLMRTVTEELTDRFAETGHCEFMADFADHYPVRIMCELLGVPLAQQHSFREWTGDLGLVFSPDVVAHQDRIEAGLAALFRSVDALIEYRRRHPGPDLLSALIDAEEAGDRMSTQELRLMVSTLLFGSQETTRYQLGRAMVLFADHPDQWQRLAEQPELAAQATEEIFRVAPSTPLNARIITEPVTLHGLDIPANSVVFLVIAAANTDPEVFGPGGFDITAHRPAPPLTLGGGMHYCLGAALARAEIAEALPILARRLPHFQLTGTVEWRPSGLMGPSQLPLRFPVPAFPVPAFPEPGLPEPGLPIPA